MIIVDSSAFIASVIDDEINPNARKIYNLVVATEDMAIVPSLFYYEAANVLLKSLRRQRINKNEYRTCLNLLLAFPLIVDEETPVFEIALLAEKHDLSFYDAAYLELAIRGGYSLASLDKRLLDAASKENIKLELNL